MLPPEKDDGNIEYKRYILIKIDKELEELWNFNDISQLDSNSPSTPLLNKIKNEKNSNTKNYTNLNTNLGDMKTPYEEIQEYKINKCIKSNLRFNQLATQMKFRISEGDGIAIYYLGVNNDGSIYSLSRDEKTKSLKILKEIVKFIKCRIEKLSFIDSYIKVIIKDDIKFSNNKEKRILLLGDTESGKTTFLAYLIKNIVDTNECKARLHILNHKHEIESGKTSSFTYQYLNFNETKFVFIDTPGFDGDNINFKSSKKRNKLLLSIDFDLILFFDKSDKIWNKKNIYLSYATHNKIPFISLNLFNSKNFINLVNPVSQEIILNYLYSLFSNNDKFQLNRCHSKTNLFDNEDDYIIFKRKEYKRKFKKNIKDKSFDDFEHTNFFSEGKSSYFDNLKDLSKFNFSLESELEDNKIKNFSFDTNKFVHTNLNFISSYPHQDIGLVLSGFLSEGELYMGMKLFCYIDFKSDTFKSVLALNSLALEEIKKCNPIEIIIKSIHKDGENVKLIKAPSIITISIDYTTDYGRNNFHNEMLKLIKIKDFQINFLSNYCYQDHEKFKLFWIDKELSVSVNKLEDDNYSFDECINRSINKPHDKLYESINSTLLNTNEVTSENIQIVVRNQIINLKKVSLDSNEFYYTLNNKNSSSDFSNLFNINDKYFFSDDSDLFGFGIIRKYNDYN
tara:strand:+ start:3066 stop:5099 length:2034 start_codon:yes stop_codon:yes gene_type:complete